MRIEITRECGRTDAYVELEPKDIASTVVLRDGVNIDLDKFGFVVGVEVLSPMSEVSILDIESVAHVHSNVRGMLTAILSQLSRYTVMADSPNVESQLSAKPLGDAELEPC